jgi:hypothetical protein
MMFLNIPKDTMLMIVATRSLRLLLSGVRTIGCSFRRSMNSANEIPPGLRPVNTDGSNNLPLCNGY